MRKNKPACAGNPSFFHGRTSRVWLGISPNISGEVEGFCPSCRKLEKAALVQADRIFHSPGSLGILIIGPEGLKRAFFIGWPDPAFSFFFFGQKTGVSPQAASQDGSSRGIGSLTTNPGLISLGLQLQPDPKDIPPAPPVGIFRWMGRIDFLILYPLENGS